MHRLALAPFIAILATCGHAAFDLQVLSKYRVSALCSTAFSHAKSGPNSTVAVAGRVGYDVFVAQFDGLGNLIRLATWDSPTAGFDTLVDLGVGPDGSPYLLVESDIYDYTLVKFSPTYTLQWERAFPMAASPTAKLAVSDTGIAHMIFKGGTADIQYRAVNASGSQVGSSQIIGAFDTIRDMDAHPAPSSGVSVVGAFQNRGMWRRIETNGTVSASETTGNSESTTNMVKTCIALPNSKAWYGGSAFDAGFDKGFFRESGLPPLFISPTSVDRIVYRSANSFRFLSSTGAITQTGILDQFPSSPFTHTYKVLGILADDVIDLSSLNVTMLKRPGRAALDFYSMAADPVFLSTQTPGANAIAKISDGAGAAIYSGLGSSTLSIQNIWGYSSAEYVFTGAPYRYLEDAVPQSDGSIVIAVQSSRVPQGEILILKYRPDGTVAWARAITHPSQPVSQPSLVQRSDGSFVVLYRLSSPSNATVGYARLTASGALAETKNFNIPAPPRASFAGPNGDVYGVGLGSEILLYKISSAGVLQWVRALGGGPDIGPYNVSAKFLANGKLALSFCIDDISDSAALYQINPSDGAVDYSTSLAANVSGSRMELDSAGNPVIAVQTGTSLVLRRRSATNLATQLGSASHANVDRIGDMKISPNGKIMAAVSTVGVEGYELRAFASTLTTFTTSAIEPGVSVTGLAVDPANLTYVVGDENPTSSVYNVYAAKYLANGARSAQRRIAGQSRGIYANPAAGVWITGDVVVRKQGRSPFVARYSP